jgi:hypothetical protein
VRQAMFDSIRALRNISHSRIAIIRESGFNSRPVVKWGLLTAFTPGRIVALKPSSPAGLREVDGLWAMSRVAIARGDAA